MLERVLRAVSDAGVDPGTLGVPPVPPAGETEEDGFVSLEQFVEVLEAAARALEDPMLGLRLGLAMDPCEFGVLGFVAMNSPTYAEMVANLGRYLQIHQTQSEIATQRAGDRWAITYRVPDPRLADRYQDGECTVGIFVAAIRLLTGDQGSASEVHLRRGRPANTTDYEALIAAPVHFGRPLDAVLVSDAVMATEIVGADADLLPVLEAHARDLIERLPGDDPLLAELRRAIADSLPTGAPRLQAAARPLGMSERTLQRRLDERGLSFQQVVEEIRECLAREYVPRRDLSLTEVAFLLGYSELSAFGRAFRRWTGKTPRAFRKDTPVS